jgi:hypothetical protein
MIWDMFKKPPVLKLVDNFIGKVEPKATGSVVCGTDPVFDRRGGHA